MSETQKAAPFTWRRTFPDAHYDFVAYEGEIQVGRIYRHRYGGADADTWFWTCTWPHTGRDAEGVPPLSGDVATRDAAIDALAAAWVRAKAWSARTGTPLRYT